MKFRITEKIGNRGTMMWFWWFMFVSNMLMPVILLIGGRMMWKHCPKEINSVIGYRTKRSMKNMDTWKFAHEYCGKLWWRMGLLLLFPSILVQLPFVHSSEEIIGTVGIVICTVQVILLVASIFPTERALKRTFTDEGVRRSS